MSTSDVLPCFGAFAISDCSTMRPSCERPAFLLTGFHVPRAEQRQ